MRNPCCKLHWSGQICPLLLATRVLSFIPGCRNYYSPFCSWIFSLFHRTLSDMPAFDYKQNGSSQMFLQSVFSARYQDIFCIYMLLTFAATSCLKSILDFLCISLAFLLKHSQRCIQNIRPSKRYALSKNVSANNLGIFPK